MLAALALLALVQSVDSTVMLGVRVAPDTVTVGAPFQVVVRIRAPRGSRIEFSLGPDSTGTVQALDTRRIADSPDTTGTEAMATYRLAAWDVGSQQIVIPDAIVRLPSLAARPVPIAPLTVFVRRVAPTPKDSTRRAPKAARPILPALDPWWWRWAVAVGALVILLLLLWWLTRRSRRPEGVRLRDPYEEALAELDRIERLGLIDAGERGRYVALVTQAVRDYLAGRIPSAALSLTTLELLDALRDNSRVPLERLRTVLEESDQVKFARARVSTERAIQVATDARQVVQETETARAAETSEAAPATGTAA
ncbi:MAG TPA: hypothetical protein VFA43_10380 [Gemmatimonadaceae bacterium]|nr:hypothetical protein [Gemmatimonadaceae bacterium]